MCLDFKKHEKYNNENKKKKKKMMFRFRTCI